MPKYLKVYLNCESDKESKKWGAKSPESFKEYLLEKHHLTVAGVEVCDEEEPQKVVARETLVTFMYVRDCPHWSDGGTCLNGECDYTNCVKDEMALPPKYCPCKQVEVQ